MAIVHRMLIARKIVVAPLCLDRRTWLPLTFSQVRESTYKPTLGSRASGRYSPDSLAWGQMRCSWRPFMAGRTRSQKFKMTKCQDRKMQG